MLDRIKSKVLLAMGVSCEVRDQLRAERMGELEVRKVEASRALQRAYSSMREADLTVEAIRAYRRGKSIQGG
jgi:hypothetical protein